MSEPRQRPAITDNGYSTPILCIAAARFDLNLTSFHPLFLSPLSLGTLAPFPLLPFALIPFLCILLAAFPTYIPICHR